MKRLFLAIFLLAHSCTLTPCFAGYLTQRDKARITFNRPDYEWAANMTGMPWMALASIHYREADLKRIPCVRGGAFMLDPGGKTKLEYERRVQSYECYVAGKYGYIAPHNPKWWRPTDGPCPSVESNFRFACLVAADEFKSKVRGKLYYYRRGKKTVDEDTLADALWGYNGRAQKSWKQSACVWSDPQRGRRIEVKVWDKGRLLQYKDSRPGTMVIYRELIACTIFQDGL